jgi:long-subunit fatty acid transport protein
MSANRWVRAAAVATIATAGVLPTPAAAQIDSALLSKLSFNLTNPGGKSLAMGGAFAAIADDATAALANPAGLGLMSSVQVGISGKWLNGTVGLVTARSTAVGPLTAPYGPITSSASPIGLDSESVDYAGVVVPVSRRLVLALSYAQNLNFEGEAPADGYQYIEFRDNRSGGVTRRDFLYEYREFGSATLRNRLVALSGGFRITDRVRVGAGVTLNRSSFELGGDGAGAHRITSTTYLSPVTTEIRTVTMGVEDFGGTVPGWLVGVHADLDERGMVSVGATFQSAAKTSGTFVIGGDVPAGLAGETRRAFTFSIPANASLGVAVRPFAGMTVAGEGQWIQYSKTFNVALPVVSYSGLVGPPPGVYVESALATVDPTPDGWVPRVGVEYVATAGTTRIAFRLGWHLEPKRGITEQLVVADGSGAAFAMDDPPFSGGVAAVFDGGESESRFSGGLGFTFGSALSLDAAFDVGKGAQNFAVSLFWRF